ncbi:MAG: methylenetetrahydrofolate reductase C-terminal domain-containing protein [Deltaproteobacteria bacterium]|nr:methylenetetrahydrofolate reductase C-terminal domain-containing protein [Deltaproteobacteria bacterium]
MTDETCLQPGADPFRGGRSFRQSLAEGTFSIAWELVPGRGAREPEQEEVLNHAGLAAQGGKVHAVTITDNAGGNPAFLADLLGAEILRLGIEPLVHLTCKDRNRNQLESSLYALDRAGVRNILVLSGDYPVTGFQGRAKPVFDLDPVQLLELIGAMNRGLETPGLKGPIRHQPSRFFAGVAVSPFKATEAEVLAQYFKLKKKLAAGAGFAVTQLGYDARKFHEVLQWMQQAEPPVPLVGNLYVLAFGAAKVMHGNRIPGCIVSDRLLAELDREKGAPDKGVGARLLRAARMYAIMKGMGFAGVHIGGHRIPYSQVEEIIEQGEALSPNWRDLVHHFDDPQPGGFYYYERDSESGLNAKAPTTRAGRPLDAPVTPVYRLSRFVHRLIFEPGKNLYGAMAALSKRLAGTPWEGPFHKLEHLSKVLLYDCQDCGDCALTDVAYSCPMSQCPKNQRNGACGGSLNGFCEVYPNERHCIYVKAYARLKHYGEEGSLADRQVPPCNWDFYQSSSWINYYLGRDHTSRRLGIPKIAKK